MDSLHLQIFESLRVLNLAGNEIYKLDGLPKQSTLKELILDRNHIRVVEPDSFSGMNSLTLLSLDDNVVRSLAGFSLLTNLLTLKMASNKIFDLFELDKLAISTLVDISLSGNPVSRKSHYRAHLIHGNPSLQVIDDKKITPEEREKADYLNELPIELPKPITNQNPQPGKVTLKLNYLNFDSVVKNGLNGTTAMDNIVQSQAINLGASNAASRKTVGTVRVAPTKSTVSGPVLITKKYPSVSKLKL